jgi:hypothetical protein
MRILLSVLIVVLSAGIAHPARFADRGVFLNPLADKIEGEGGFIHSLIAWTEFSRYFSRTDEAHHWSARLGASAEMFRLRNDFSIYIESSIELICGTNSDIRFEPLSFFWQESVFVMHRLPDFIWGVGYYHRCKHDIDNARRLLRIDEARERILVYDSVSLKFAPNPFVFQWSDNFSSSIKILLENHFFVLWNDWVLEEIRPREFTIFDLVNTIDFGARFDLLNWKDFGIYFKPNLFWHIYRNETETIFPLDILLEAGIEARGAKASFRFFIRYEKFFEPGIEPFLQSGEYAMVGVKVL